MKLAWIEDFLTLVDAGTFSKAATLRNVTQPAFSRRIRMFEDWLGVELVSRRSHRLQLTKTGARFEPELRRMVSASYELRSKMRAHAQSEQRIALTTQHTLMVSHLPKLLRFFRERHDGAAFNVRTGNLRDCVGQLVRGEADVMLCFEVEGEALPDSDPSEMARITVGVEKLVPVSARDTAGGPLFDPAASGSVHLLNYPEESFLGRVVRQQCLPELVRNHTIQTICESAFTMGLKEMALSGMGIAWLPHGLIERELEDGSLLALHDSLGSPTLGISLYRMQGGRYQALDDIWSILQNDTPQL
jgi:DNA-binding transcriptional LysR family regulator